MPRKYETFDAFIKDEPYFKCKPPRLILNARPLRKVINALCLWRLNARFFDQPFSVKKMPYGARVKYINQYFEGYSFFYGTDHSAFDAHISYQTQKDVEAHFYQLTTQLSKSQISGIIGSRMMRIRTKDVECVMPRTRASGDYQTSLGNTLINYVLLKLYDQNLKVLVEGDDSLFASKTPVDMRKLEEFMQSYGFEIKIEAYPSPGDAGFCGLFFDQSGGYAADYAKTLMKFLVVPNHVGDPLTYLKCRVLSAFYNSPNSRIFAKLHHELNGEYLVLTRNKYQLEKMAWMIKDGNLVSKGNYYYLKMPPPEYHAEHQYYNDLHETFVPYYSGVMQYLSFAIDFYAFESSPAILLH